MPFARSSRLSILAICLACAACDAKPREDRSSVTVKLPPARPYTPEPSFSFGKQSSDLPEVRQQG
jgi:hypothetical protein